MSTHVMLDIETMGGGSYAAIISIGAVKFDPMARPKRGVLPPIETFYAYINLESSVKAGLRMDPSTVLWWLGQPQATITSLKQELAIGLDEALLGFAAWYGEDDTVPVWGNGADFDNVIVRNAYQVVGIDCPWGYKANRCFRTLKNLQPAVKEPVYGAVHNALDDAIRQARWLQAIVKKHRLVL